MSHDALQLYLSRHFFPSWQALLNCVTPRQQYALTQSMESVVASARTQHFESMLPRLNGDEKCYLVWRYNLYQDDPSRPQGERLPPELPQ